MITKRQELDWLEKIQAAHRVLIRESVNDFEDNSPEARSRRMQHARADVKFFCKTYLPQYFTDDFATFHDDMIHLMEQRDSSFSVISAPREHAKSTLRMGYMIHQGCFDLRHYLILLSLNEKAAIGHLVPIKINFEENPRIKADFGQRQRAGWWEDGDFVWDQSRFRALGIDQSPRGTVFFNWRPDFIAPDDVETKKSTKNPDLCKERADYMKEEVFGALAQDGTLFWVGNWIRSRSALAMLIKESDKNPEIQGRIYRAITKMWGGRLLWPAHWTKKALKKRYRIMGSVSFMREYMSMDPEAGNEFPEDKIQYYKPSELKNKKGTRITYGDPAHKGTKRGHSNQSWITTEYVDGVWYVIHAFIKNTPLSRWIDHWFLIYKQYGGRGFFEAVGAQYNYTENFRPIANRMGLPAPMPRNVTQNKEDRIVDTLSPLIESGRIRFLKGNSDQDLLVEQLIYFGSPGMEKDGPDALEGCVRHTKSKGPQIIAVTDIEDDDEEDDF